MDRSSRIIQKVSIRNFLAYKEVDVEGFDPNINLIIGTNGSGKTSFFKSIEFALTTNIRYSSQLFNKLANDQEIKELSVSVQLANEYAFTRKLLPLTETYRINEKPVNAAMYHHLIKYYFLDCSLLISQGKIHQLIASSDRLRAELALFSASMNNVGSLRAIVQQLLAKFDSINEYRTQLFNDLRGDMQAKQEDRNSAERISRIRDEIKLVQTVMQARKIDSLKQRIKRKKEKYAEVKRELNDLVEERVSKEAELNRLRQGLEEEEVPVNGLSQEDALKELTTKKVQLDLESEDCESQLLEKQEQRSRLAEQLAAVKEEIERKQASLAQQKLKLDELKEAEQVLAKDVKTKRFDLDQLFSHAGESDGAARKQQAEQQVETLKEEIAELRKHVDELTIQRAAAGERVKQLSADQAKNDEAIEKAKQAIARLKVENLNCETLRRKLCAEIDKHKGRLNKYADQKRDFYPLLGRSFVRGKENLNRVIELLREGTDEERQLVDGYYGLFLDIISFDSTFVIPVERTAKHYLHKHVVKDANTANRLLRKFDEMKLDGTCEFVALDLLKNKTVPQEESSVYQPLLKYIGHDKKIERAVKHCFQRIYVCRSIEDVIGLKKDFTFVTLDGDILMRNKSLNGGYIDKKRLWIEQYSRYTICQGLLSETTGKLDELTKNLHEHENKLQQNAIELDEHERVKSEKCLENCESRSKLSQNSVECEELERLIKQYRHVLKRKTGELADLEARLELNWTRPPISEAERLSRIGTLKSELEQLNAEHSRAISNYSRTKLEVKSLKQALKENLEKQDADLSDELKQCELDVTNLSAKLSNCQAAIKTIEGSIKQLRKKQDKMSSKGSQSAGSQSADSQSAGSQSASSRSAGSQSAGGRSAASLLLEKKQRICQLEASIEQIAFKEIELKFNLKNILQMQRTFEDEIALYQAQIEHYKDRAGKYMKMDTRKLQQAMTKLDEELAEIGSQASQSIADDVNEQRYFYLYDVFSKHHELVKLAVKLMRQEVTIERSVQTLALFFERFQQIFSLFRSSGKIQVKTQVPEGCFVGNAVNEQLSMSEIWPTLLVSFNGEVPRSLEFLSGGQRTTMSLCFLLTMLTMKQPPFLLIDESDQNLDEATCRLLGSILRQHFANRIQFFFTSNRTYFANFTDKMFRVSRTDRNSSVINEVDLDYIANQENRNSQNISVPEFSSQETTEGGERSSKRRKIGH